MIMKKLVAIISMCFCLSQVYSQTQEETIAWIKETLENRVEFKENVKGYAYLDFKVEKINPCNITITFTDKNLERNYIFAYNTYIIPTKIDSISNKGAIYSKDAIKIIYAQHDKEKSSYYSSYTEVVLIPNNQNLHERLKKALDHLNTFCKEAF